MENRPKKLLDLVSCWGEAGARRSGHPRITATNKRIEPYSWSQFVGECASVSAVQPYRKALTKKCLPITNRATNRGIRSFVERRFLSPHSWMACYAHRNTKQNPPPARYNGGVSAIFPDTHPEAEAVLVHGSAKPRPGASWRWSDK